VRERLQDLSLSIVDVAQGMHEQVVHVLDVLGKEAHGIRPRCRCLLFARMRNGWQALFVPASVARPNCRETRYNTQRGTFSHQTGLGLIWHRRWNSRTSAGALLGWRR